ncbi:hypothetical protein, partial [Leptospira levettii]|uniref:hypothetical protein n=1 Tax=Leptospira levettii TaxID=2023178 RepID=UPI000CC54A03
MNGQISQATKSYLMDWIRFELEKSDIEKIEPKSKAIEVAYKRLTSLDEQLSALDDKQIELAKPYADRIEDAKNP